MNLEQQIFNQEKNKYLMYLRSLYVCNNLKTIDSNYLYRFEKALKALPYFGQQVVKYELFHIKKLRDNLYISNSSYYRERKKVISDFLRNLK